MVSVDGNPFAPPLLDIDTALDAWRNDGALRNAVLKLGGGKDVETYHRPKPSHGLQKEEAEDFYGNDPLAQKVVTKIPNEMKRGGFELTGDGYDIKKVMAYCRDQSVLDAFHEATVYAAIYSRGAAIALQVDDDRLWRQSVDYDNIKSVSIAFVGDGYRIVPQRLSRFRQKPEKFSIAALLPTDEELDDLLENSEDAYRVFPGDRSKELRAYEAQVAKDLLEQGLDSVHSDRVLWFPGIWTPIDLETRYDGGISKLSLFWAHYSRYEAALIATANILHRMEVLIIKRKGLNKILAAATEKTEAELLRQLDTLIMSLHTLGVGLADAEQDEVDILRRSLSGIPQAIKAFKEAAIAASGLTEIDLFGFTTVSGGLSSNDLRDRMFKAEMVASEQELQWRKPMEEYLRLVFQSKEGPTGGKIPDDWNLVFPSTLVLSPVEKAELRQKQAQTDKVYFDMGLSAKIILESRFGSGSWSEETNLPDDFEVEERSPQQAEPKDAQQQVEPETPSAEEEAEQEVES